ncbi:TPA: hypothetical protein ACRZ6V_001216 [Vibrio harveyi]
MKNNDQLTKATKALAPIIRNAVNQVSGDVDRIAKAHDVDANTVLINALGAVLLGGTSNADANAMILQSNNTSWLAVGPINGAKQGGIVEKGTQSIMEGIIKLIGISEEFECDCPTCQAKRTPVDDSKNGWHTNDMSEKGKNKVVH